LVEDNLSDIGLTQRALAKNHVLNELVVAHDGQEALDFLFGSGSYVGRDLSQQPTLILLDLRLPKLDGVTVLQRIRSDERTRLLPVVVLTTSQEERDIESCYKLGANSYIVKPVDFNQFVKAVNELGMYWLVLNEPPHLQP
jgi:CheY-like chemotaxis protein